MSIGKDYIGTGIFATGAEAQSVKAAWRPGVFMGGPLGHSTGADESKRIVQELASKYGLDTTTDVMFGMDTGTGEFIAPLGWVNTKPTNVVPPSTKAEEPKSE